MCGLNTHNIQYVADAIKDAVVTLPETDWVLSYGNKIKINVINNYTSKRSINFVDLIYFHVVLLVSPVC